MQDNVTCVQNNVVGRFESRFTRWKAENLLRENYSVSAASAHTVIFLSLHHELHKCLAYTSCNILSLFDIILSHPQIGEYHTHSTLTSHTQKPEANVTNFAVRRFKTVTESYSNHLPVYTPRLSSREHI